MAELFVGLMSGTSLDGVDAVLADFSTTPHLLASHGAAIPVELRAKLLALNEPAFDDLTVAQDASVALAHLYAETTQTLLEQANVRASEVRAIGCHGQTVRHRPERGYSLQLNQPSLIAELCGIDVAADFRNRDIAAGGQGAPLVPAFHQEVLGSAEESRVVLNLGGIANLTRLYPGEPVSGFDTGPANMLLDAWIEAHMGKTFDDNGQWAASGTIQQGLLSRLLAHPFFALQPPKSCGREEFSIGWVQSLLAGNESPADVQATLMELTTCSIARAIHAHSPAPSRLLVCGGGSRNGFLMQRLAHHLPQPHIAPTDSLGVPSAWLEAFAFAWLAYKLVHREPANLPAVTGARGLRVLGALYPS